MTLYRIKKIRGLLASGKAYIKGYVDESMLYMGCPIVVRCFVVVCSDNTYLVPVEDAPSMVVLAPFDATILEELDKSEMEGN